MSKRLIFNADDFGRSPDISRGILFTHLNGVVTSTTCMMNMPSIVEDIRLALREAPSLGLGVHLVLTAGKPLLPAAKQLGLTDTNGRFFNSEVFFKRRNDLDPAIVKAEWRAQIEAFITAAGKNPTHLDSHHHVSYLTPSLFTAMLELAREYGLPIRLPLAHGTNPLADNLLQERIEELAAATSVILEKFQPHSPDIFFASFYGDRANRGELTRIMSHFLSNGTFEIMCHPGFMGNTAPQESSYTTQRETELRILTDPAVRREIIQRGIELVSYAAL